MDVKQHFNDAVQLKHTSTCSGQKTRLERRLVLVRFSCELLCLAIHTAEFTLPKSSAKDVRWLSESTPFSLSLSHLLSRTCTQNQSCESFTARCRAVTVSLSVAELWQFHCQVQSCDSFTARWRVVTVSLSVTELWQFHCQVQSCDSFTARCRARCRTVTVSLPGAELWQFHC